MINVILEIEAWELVGCDLKVAFSVECPELKIEPRLFNAEVTEWRNPENVLWWIWKDKETFIRAKGKITNERLQVEFAAEKQMLFCLFLCIIEMRIKEQAENFSLKVPDNEGLLLVGACM